MNKLANIDWDKVKTFIKGNPVLCALLALDIFLLFVIWGHGDVNESIQNKISSLQLKEKQIRANLTKLNGLEKDFETLGNIKNDILNKCINFGEKVTIYNFLKQMDSSLPENKINISNVNLYDINKKRNINFNQDLSEFDGDVVIAGYNASLTGTTENFIEFLGKLNQLPYFINLQKLEMKNDPNKEAAPLNVNLNFDLLGKIQLKE